MNIKYYKIIQLTYFFILAQLLSPFISLILVSALLTFCKMS